MKKVKRYPGQSIYLSNGVIIDVIKVNGAQVDFDIEAPEGVNIFADEVTRTAYLKNKRTNKAIDNTGK